MKQAFGLTMDKAPPGLTMDHADLWPDGYFGLRLSFSPAFASLGPWAKLRLKMNRAVFFDRDGTLIVDKDYLHRPEEVVIFPTAAAALKALQNAGFKLFIVSNQSGVGRGYFLLAEVE